MNLQKRNHILLFRSSKPYLECFFQILVHYLNSFKSYVQTLVTFTVYNLYNLYNTVYTFTVYFSSIENGNFEPINLENFKENYKKFITSLEQSKKYY